MPLASDGEHRFRVTLPIDAPAIYQVHLVSEETGSISISHAGRMIRRIDPKRLENILVAFFRRDNTMPQRVWMKRYFPYLFTRKDK